LKSELLKSVVDVANRPANAASVSVGSIGAGLGAYLEWLSPIVGLLAALAGLTLSVMLAIRAYYNIKMDKLRLEELEEEHNGSD
jgi:hypothetical protein